MPAPRHACLAAFVLLGACIPALAIRPSPSKPADTNGSSPANVAIATRSTAEPGPQQLAHRLWILTDVVLDRHIEPPARQEMLLAGLKVVLKKAGLDQPSNLTRRVSGLTTESDLQKVLEESWPKLRAKGKPSAEQLATTLLRGALTCVPGQASLQVEMPSAEDTKIAEQLSANRYVGTGIQLGYNEKEGFAQIINPFRRCAARCAGAKPGDLIERVDDVDVHNAGVARVVKLLRGEEGTPVSMTVRQPQSKERRTLKLVRSVVVFDTIYGYHRLSEEKWSFRIHPDEPIGYVWISAILSSTVHELRRTESLLREEGIRALVVDLRSVGSAALLHNTTLLADELLDGGVMWRVRDVHNAVKEFRAEPGCALRDWPLVVLVDESLRTRAAQCLVAALQDNHRAVIVGSPAKVDAYLNSLVQLPEQQGTLTLSTGMFERAISPRLPASAPDEPPPSATTVWLGWPDRLIQLSEAQREALHKWRADKELPELPPGATDVAPADPQLAEAVKVLREALRKAPPNGKTL